MVKRKLQSTLKYFKKKSNKRKILKTELLDFGEHKSETYEIDTLQKIHEILEWASTNPWAHRNFDDTTIQNIYDDNNTSKYNWPSDEQERAVDNVYDLCQRAQKWH